MILPSEKIGIPCVREGWIRREAGKEVSNTGMVGAQRTSLCNAGTNDGGSVGEERLHLAGCTTKNGCDWNRKYVPVMG